MNHVQPGVILQSCGTQDHAGAAQKAELLQPTLYMLEQGSPSSPQLCTVLQSFSHAQLSREAGLQLLTFGMLRKGNPSSP